jgi:hypothetical protein
VSESGDIQTRPPAVCACADRSAPLHVVACALASLDGVVVPGAFTTEAHCVLIGLRESGFVLVHECGEVFP